MFLSAVAVAGGARSGAGEPTDNLSEGRAEKKSQGGSFRGSSFSPLSVLLTPRSPSPTPPLANTINNRSCVVDARHVRQHMQQEPALSGGGGAASTGHGGDEPGAKAGAGGRGASPGAGAAAASRAVALNETAQQLAFADVILLNKTDLVTPEQLELVRREVRRVNGTARLIDCRLNAALGGAVPGGAARVAAAAAAAAVAAAAGQDPQPCPPAPAPPLEELLGCNAFSVDRALQVDPAFLDSDSGAGTTSDDGDDDEEGGEGGAGGPGGPGGGAGHGGEEGGSSRSEDAEDAGTGTAGPSHPSGGATHAGGGGAAAAAAAAAAGGGGASSGATGTGTAATTTMGGGSGGGNHAASTGRAGGGGLSARGASADSLSGMAEDAPPSNPLVAASSGRKHGGHGGHAHGGGRGHGHSGQRASKVARSPSQARLHEAVALATAGDRRPKRRRKQMHDLSGIGSVGIVARGPLDEYRFNMFMRDVLAEKARDIFRCKGVLAVHGYGDRKFVFQGVHETICYGPADKPWAEGEARVNQIVFVGRGLCRRSLMEGFRTCVWTPLPDGWREFCDPVTGQPYYCHAASGRKTWARPEAARPAAGAVTATRLQSFEQPRSSRPPAAGAPQPNGSSLQQQQPQVQAQQQAQEQPTPPQSRPAPPLGSDGTVLGHAAAAAAAVAAAAPSNTRLLGRHDC